MAAQAAADALGVQPRPVTGEIPSAREHQQVFTGSELKARLGLMLSSREQPVSTAYLFPRCDAALDEDSPLGACLVSPFLQEKQPERLGREMWRR